MLEFLIDNIFVSFGGTLFQQVVGIPMGTNCTPLLADLLLYSYESEFLQKRVKDKKIHEARAFNFTYRYIDDVLSINNSRFAEFLPLIYRLRNRLLDQGYKKNRLIRSLKKFIFRYQDLVEYGTALTIILPILFLYLNTVIVTAGTFEP
jgi:hypothetical protein